MTTCKITMMDGLPAVQLTAEMLAALGLEIGAEVEVAISDRRLIIRTAVEAQRKAKLKQIFEDLLVERDSAYRKLAEGVK